MNYWLAEQSNLSECHEPMLDFIRDLAQNGKETARVNYGCQGWVAHHNADLWRQSAPVGDYGKHGQPTWANWAMGGVWHCMDLWEHYAFTGDTAYLRQTAFPLMQEAALFWLDYLVEDEQGHLVSLPSYSPEHGGISAGASMDHQMVWDLFTNCVNACDILGIRTDFKRQLSSALEKLSPPRIGRWGQLQEWIEDVDDPKNQHRHVSHFRNPRLK